MRTIITNPARETWADLLRRPTITLEDIDQTVDMIFSEIQTKGDQAVLKYSQLFDNSKSNEIKVSIEEINSSGEKINDRLKEAIQKAKSNIEVFHRAQITETVSVQTTEGVQCWQEKRPIENIGLYIPGGTAPLFSTVLMLAVPAQIAGCKSIVLCSPPNRDGKIAPEILYTANLCGVTEIFMIGGIQAIAAMSIGTETVPKVDKLFGPGNQYVTIAKQWAQKYGVAMDMPAGPSELLVLADESAIPSYVASDLLSQAEHGKDSQVVLVSDSMNFIQQVQDETLKQLEGLNRRAIAKSALSNSKFICIEDKQSRIDLVNAYGPEHLIICTRDDEFYLDNIVNAGSVFVGNWTPESAGDYASGTNHTLPTNGFTSAYSGVNLDSFLKSITFQKITKEGLRNLGPTVEIMAEAEGLQAHKNAVSIRLKDI